MEEAAEQQTRRCALTSRGYEGVAGVSKMCVNKSMYEYSNARVKHQVPSKPPAPLSTSSKWSAHTAPRIQRSPTPHASPARHRQKTKQLLDASLPCEGDACVSEARTTIPARPFSSNRPPAGRASSSGHPHRNTPGIEKYAQQEYSDRRLTQAIKS